MLYKGEKPLKVVAVHMLRNSNTRFSEMSAFSEMEIR